MSDQHLWSSESNRTRDPFALSAHDVLIVCLFLCVCVCVVGQLGDPGDRGRDGEPGALGAPGRNGFPGMPGSQGFPVSPPIILADLYWRFIKK